MLGDPTKAMTKLGWKPKVDVDELIAMMADHDFDLARKEFVMQCFDKNLHPSGSSFDKHK